MSNKTRLFDIMKGYKRFFIIALLATGASAFFSMINPMIIRLTVDSIINKEPMDVAFYMEWAVGAVGGLSYLERNLWICGLSIVIISTINGLFTFARGRCSSIAAESMANRLKDNLYDHLQKLPYNYHVKAQTGDLIQRCTSDVDTIRRFFALQLVEVGRTICIVLFAIPIMLSLNVKLALASFIIFPIVFVMSFVFFSKVKQTFKRSDEKEGELSTVLQENLSGVRVVRAFGREAYEMGKFKQKNDEYKGLVMKIFRLLATYWTISDFLSITQMAAIIIYGIVLINRGELSIGTLILFNSYEGMLIWPVRQLGRILSDMGKMQVSLTRVSEILNTPQEAESETALESDLSGDIVFNDVHFEYESGKPVLNGLSFTAKKGETIAILGNTGSGKSTIMHLLLRLYDYKRGSVTINGTELKLIKKHWLRSRVGIVLQEPFLFSKSIKENIRMARATASDEEIFDSARTACVHDVIEGFEEGYGTVVGERGVTLSGGQKQRVAIARMLVKNSDILIFDDSLSAVDTETDEKIRKALKERKTKATTFIISQRITTLMEADRILVMEHGKITHSGTHQELIAVDGLYKRIWDIQTMLEVDFGEVLA